MADKEIPNFMAAVDAAVRTFQETGSTITVKVAPETGGNDPVTPIATIIGTPDQAVRMAQIAPTLTVVKSIVPEPKQ